ncbi:hypothetical protein BDR06DRAFT_1025759 [Suillus hirtellus]|nr:hypothetical protein BDR06DRAFT_1025759 [Suillus hirtellus]
MPIITPKQMVNIRAQPHWHEHCRVGFALSCVIRDSFKHHHDVHPRKAVSYVLRDWQMTNRFLEELSEGLLSSWTRFYNITVEVPDLLHLVKSIRTLPNPSHAAVSSSPQVSHLWIHLDELRRQGAGAVGMVNQVAQQLMVSTSAALSAIHVSLESSCGRLKERMIRYRKILENKPSSAQRIRLDSRLSGTEHEHGRVE